MKKYIIKNSFYCPISDDYFELSEYLKNIFRDNPKALWFANMVTHYRHNHISWWNNCWGANGNRYQGNWFKDYDDEKKKVNESSKRQIIRKCHEYMNFHEITIDDLMELTENEKKTILVAEKFLKRRKK